MKLTNQRLAALAINTSNRRYFVEELADIAIRLIERDEQDEQEDTNHGK